MHYVPIAKLSENQLDAFKKAFRAVPVIFHPHNSRHAETLLWRQPGNKKIANYYQMMKERDAESDPSTSIKMYAEWQDLIHRRINGLIQGDAMSLENLTLAKDVFEVAYHACDQEKTITYGIDDRGARGQLVLSTLHETRARMAADCKVVLQDLFTAINVMTELEKQCNAVSVSEDDTDDEGWY